MNEGFKVPSGEIDNRRKRIQELLQTNNIDGLLIVQRVDLFYFSGTAQNGALYMPADGEPLLMIKKYLPRAVEESSIKNAVEIKSLKDIPAMINDFYGGLPGILGFEFDVMPVKDFNLYKQLLPAGEYVDGSNLIIRSRMIKSDWEILQMEKTAELSQKTFEYMKSAIRPGYTETEFAAVIETFSRRLGHGGFLRSRNYNAEVYAWHILSGKSGGIVGLLDSPATGTGTSAAFPCGGGGKELLPNEPIMVDFGTVLNGYHMDETRMFAIGAMPDKAFRACEASIEIHNKVLDAVKPGVTLAELYQVSVSKAESLGYSEQFLGPPGYKVTFVGHGIGLELVESPIIADGKEYHLEAGMTFSLEPKMVFKNEFSAGIESVFLVTQKGCRLISKVPVDIFICQD
jgi:Xaa-Pro dipeptidase